MGFFSVKPTGFEPADTLKRTPHGRFITWLTGIDREPKKTKPASEPIDFTYSERPPIRTAQEIHDSQVLYYDSKTGSYVYKDTNAEQKKSLWQKIKDWFSGNKTKENENNNIYESYYYGGE